jgi:hypothetical protein
MIAFLLVVLMQLRLIPATDTFWLLLLSAALLVYWSHGLLALLLVLIVMWEVSVQCKFQRGCTSQYRLTSPCISRGRCTSSSGCIEKNLLASCHVPPLPSFVCFSMNVETAFLDRAPEIVSFYAKSPAPPPLAEFVKR